MLSLAGAVFATEPEHGLPQSAVRIEHWGGFITNSMVVSWIVAIALLIFARIATRDMKGVPGGAQNLLEWLVESLYGFLESIIGRTWSSGRFGFWQISSSSFSQPIGLV
jgi:F-type H+-transporting ATPase subunit a